LKIRDDGSISIRQSWLSDFLMCPERARLSALYPELDRDSDVAALGTGVHFAIQKYLEGDLALGDMQAAATHYARQQVETEDIEWIDLTPETFINHAGYLTKAWVDNLSYSVPKGGLCEYTFEVPICSVTVAQTVVPLILTGTIDYITPDPNRYGLWDWKTSGRKYDQWKRQRWAIQPSAYTLAVALLGDHLGPVEYPLDFHYGIMLRKERRENSVAYAAPSDAQQVTVRRFDTHGTWFIEQAKRAVEYCLKNSADQPWPAVDSHELCSQKWCPWWDHCKGAHVSVEQLTWKQGA
jgi:hypothetical protein